MSRSFIVFAALVAAACGQHYFVNLTGASAVRDADDHVTVTTTHGCEAVGPKTCSAETVPEYCVTARWLVLAQRTDGGQDALTDAGVAAETVVATAKACSTGDVVKPLVLRSDNVVPVSPATEIDFTVTGGRNDINRFDGGINDRIPSP